MLFSSLKPDTFPFGCCREDTQVLPPPPRSPRRFFLGTAPSAPQISPAPPFCEPLSSIMSSFPFFSMFLSATLYSRVLFLCGFVSFPGFPFFFYPPSPYPASFGLSSLFPSFPPQCFRPFRRAPSRQGQIFPKRNATATPLYAIFSICILRRRRYPISLFFLSPPAEMNCFNPPQRRYFSLRLDFPFLVTRHPRNQRPPSQEAWIRLLPRFGSPNRFSSSPCCKAFYSD